MTIDEAIKQEKEKAVDCMQGAEVVKNMTYATWERENLPKQYLEKAEYHKQLAEWLEELEEMWKSQGQVGDFWYSKGYTRAIQDFVDKVEFDVGAEDRDIYCKEIVKVIAEQLKAGGTNG